MEPAELNRQRTTPAGERPVAATEGKPGEPDALALARRLGEAEAELTHLRLSLRESTAREMRLVERMLKAEEAFDRALATEHDLREQIARYAGFHEAVRRSRPWRFIQFVRRLAGREW